MCAWWALGSSECMVLRHPQMQLQRIDGSRRRRLPVATRKFIGRNAAAKFCFCFVQAASRRRDYKHSSPALSPLVLLRPLGCGVAFSVSKIPARLAFFSRQRFASDASLVVRHTQRRSAMSPWISRRSSPASFNSVRERGAGDPRSSFATLLGSNWCQNRCRFRLMRRSMSRG